MIPFRFASLSGQLYGAFHPPSGERRASHGVLLCNPFGQEAIRSHRLFRVLADRLASMGHGVLRFDYFATGDSDGSDDEADLDAWIGDVQRAHAELCRLCGCREVSWFGLRLGATIAALASARATSTPSRLVLWDPITSGDDYLASLARTHLASIASARHAAGNSSLTANASMPTEALGFPLTPAFRRQLGGLTEESWSNCRAYEAWLLGNEASSLDLVDARLRATIGRTERVHIDSRIDWTSHEAMNTPIAPADVLQAIVGILKVTA